MVDKTVTHSRRVKVFQQVWERTGYLPYAHPIPSYEAGASSVVNCDVTKFYSPYSLDNWKKRIKEDLNCTTQLDVHSTHLDMDVPANCYQCSERVIPYNEYWDGGQRLSLVTQMPAGSSYGSSVTAAYNRAAIDYLQKIHAKQHAFQGGVFLGELKESIELLMHPAKKLRAKLDQLIPTVRRRTRGIEQFSQERFIQRSRKRKFSIYRGSDYVWNSDYVVTRTPHPRSLSYHEVVNKVASETWLEWAFGVKPLVSDLRNGAEAIAKIRYPVSETVRGRGVDEKLSASVGIIAGGGHYGNFSWKNERVDRSQAKYVGKIAVKRFSMYDTPSMASHFGLSWDMVVPTIYELIPYSFLVDYFSNLGGLIDALSVNQSCVIWQYRGYKQSITDTCYGTSYTGLNNAGWKVVSNHVELGKAVRVREDLHREPYDLQLSPVLEFKIPGISTKWINMAALTFSHDSARKKLRI